MIASDRSVRRACHARNEGLPKRILIELPLPVSGGKSSTQQIISCKEPCKQAIAGDKFTKGFVGSYEYFSSVAKAHDLPMASAKPKSSVFVEDSMKCFMSVSSNMHRRGNAATDFPSPSSYSSLISSIGFDAV